LSVRPDEVLPRRDLELVSRRLPTEAEAASLGPGMIVVECRLGEDISQFGTVASGSGGDGRDGSARDGRDGRDGSGGPAAGDGPGGSAAAASGPGATSGPDAGPVPGKVVTVELALGESALTGLLSWLEAAPPGSHLDVSR
jgi:hypothetical protein